MRGGKRFRALLERMWRERGLRGYEGQQDEKEDFGWISRALIHEEGTYFD